MLLNSLTNRTRCHAHAGRPNLHMVGQATAFVWCGAHAVRAAVAAHRLALHRHVRMLLETVAAELDATERRFGLRTDTYKILDHQLFTRAENTNELDECYFCV